MVKRTHFNIKSQCKILDMLEINFVINIVIIIIIIIIM